MQPGATSPHSDPTHPLTPTHKSRLRKTSTREPSSVTKGRRSTLFHEERWKVAGCPSNLVEKTAECSNQSDKIRRPGSATFCFIVILPRKAAYAQKIVVQNSESQIAPSFFSKSGYCGFRPSGSIAAVIQRAFLTA